MDVSARRRAGAPQRGRWGARRLARLPAASDPARELAAESRARELLRSCLNADEWAMYEELGFVRVWGGGGQRAVAAVGGARYAYLLYPHKPIVAYVPEPLALLSEYCVRFHDATALRGSERLPPSDDVLAKWLALSSDERELINAANVAVVGHQLDPRRVVRDLARLGAWEQARIAVAGSASAARCAPDRVSSQ